MVTNIPLTLRQVKGAELLWTEVDANFTGLRDAILTIAAALNLSRLVIGSEPALGERPGTAWIPTDHSGLFAWNTVTSAWDRIREPVLYAVATGSANNYAVTLSGIAALADLTGRVWAFKVNHENTGAVQLNVNSLGLTGVVYHGAALTNAMLRVGYIAQVLYDGSQFQLINPAIDIPAAAELPTFDVSAEVTVPDNVAGKVDIAHDLGKAPCMVRVVGVCQSAVDGYSTGDELDIACVTSDMDGGAEDASAYGVSANTTTVTVSCQLSEWNSNSLWYPAKAGGQASWYDAITGTPKWKLKAYTMAAP